MSLEDEDVVSVLLEEGGEEVIPGARDESGDTGEADNKPEDDDDGEAGTIGRKEGCACVGALESSSRRSVISITRDELLSLLLLSLSKSETSVADEDDKDKESSSRSGSKSSMRARLQRRSPRLTMLLVGVRWKLKCDRRMKSEAADAKQSYEAKSAFDSASDTHLSKIR